MLLIQSNFQTKDIDETLVRNWGVYVCRRCGGVVIASGTQMGGVVQECFPAQTSVDITVPDPARDYLLQALSSRHAPAGAVMLAASAVDAMLKSKGYSSGKLYSRIEKAVEDNLITPEMAAWAHEVRLDANDQRHADEIAVMPTAIDAGRVIEFAESLAQFLFVLPARVTRGRQGTIT